MASVLRRVMLPAALYALAALLWVVDSSWQFGAIELLLLISFPVLSAMQVAANSGHAKAFWIGMLTSATFAAFGVCVPLYHGFFYLGEHSVVFALDMLSKGFRPTIVLWAAAPLIGFTCVLSVLVGPK